MPSRLVEDNDGMGSWGNIGRDFQPMKVYGGAVALGQNETCTNPSGGLNSTEVASRVSALVVRCDRPCFMYSLAACDFVHLPDPDLVLS